MDNDNKAFAKVANSLQANRSWSVYGMLVMHLLFETCA